MGRGRKRHVQLALPRRDKNGQLRGGRRKGAGRPPNGKRSGSPHKRRPELKKRFPAHITLRVERAVGGLRKRFMFRALREATIAVAMRELAFERDGAFRIVHVSIQKTHVHLLVEADNKYALARGLQSFQISAAKHINREYSARMKLSPRRRGRVFVDRYHEEIITTPRQARRALAYVLNNWRKHREDRASDARGWNVDPFSTGIQFSGWAERADAVTFWPRRETYDPLVVYLPKTWLLSEGWRRHGLISFHEVPSAAHA